MRRRRIFVVVVVVDNNDGDGVTKKVHITRVSDIAYDLLPNM